MKDEIKFKNEKMNKKIIILFFLTIKERNLDIIIFKIKHIYNHFNINDQILCAIINIKIANK
jgi:hypothetical protein